MPLDKTPDIVAVNKQQELDYRNVSQSVDSASSNQLDTGCGAHLFATLDTSCGARLFAKLASDAATSAQQLLALMPLTFSDVGNPVEPETKGKGDKQAPANPGDATAIGDKAAAEIVERASKLTAPEKDRIRSEERRVGKECRL